MEKIIQRMFTGGWRLGALTILAMVIGLGVFTPSHEKVDQKPKPIVIIQKQEPREVIPKPIPAIVVEEPVKPKVVNVAVSRPKWTTYKMTHYTARCQGCSGITKTGYNVRKTTSYKGTKVVAVDPRFIKLGSLVEIKDGNKVFRATAVDIGGGIKGHELDLLVSTKREADRLGIKYVQLRVVRKGWAKSYV